MPYGADMRIMTERMFSDPTAIPDAETLAGLVGAIPGLMGDLRSGHAGETGAVMIYLGILAGIPRPPLSDCRVKLRMSHLVLLRARLALERVRWSPLGRPAIEFGGHRDGGDALFR